MGPRDWLAAASSERELVGPRGLWGSVCGDLGRAAGSREEAQGLAVEVVLQDAGSSWHSGFPAVGAGVQYRTGNQLLHKVPLGGTGRAGHPCWGCLGNRFLKA